MSSTPRPGHHYTGHQVAIQPTETSIQPGESFDWADASVGAGIAVMLGVLIGEPRGCPTGAAYAVD